MSTIPIPNPPPQPQPQPAPVPNPPQQADDGLLMAMRRGFERSHQLFNEPAAVPDPKPSPPEPASSDGPLLAMQRGGERLDEDDVNTIVTQTACDRMTARRELAKHGNIVDAILAIVEPAAVPDPKPSGPKPGDVSEKTGTATKTQTAKNESTTTAATPNKLETDASSDTPNKSVVPTKSTINDHAEDTPNSMPPPDQTTSDADTDDEMPALEPATIPPLKPNIDLLPIEESDITKSETPAASASIIVPEKSKMPENDANNQKDENGDGNVDVKEGFEEYMGKKALARELDGYLLARMSTFNSLSVLERESLRELLSYVYRLAHGRGSESNTELQSQILTHRKTISDLESDQKRKYRDEYMFLLDKRLLESSNKGLFKAVSEKLLKSHSDMASDICTNDQELKKMRIEWDTTHVCQSLRPSELLSALAAIIPPEFDNSERVLTEKSLATGQIYWKISKERLESSKSARLASRMKEMLGKVKVFSENNHNPFMKTAIEVLPDMHKAVKLLESNSLEHLDAFSYDIISMTILEPCTELLSSCLQSAFKDGRDAYNILLLKIEALQEEIEMARAANDLKMVVDREEELIRTTKKTLASNSALLALQAEPKHAERFLDGSSGRLAKIREQMELRLKVERQLWVDDATNYKSDIHDLTKLQEKIHSVIATEAAELKTKQHMAATVLETLVKEIGQVREEWNYEAERKRHTVFANSKRDELGAVISIEKSIEAKRLVDINIAKSLVGLASYGMRNSAAQELLDLVQKIVDIGLKGVETELRFRLNALQNDKVQLETDFRRVFTLRHSLVSNRERQIQTRLANIDRKRKELKQSMQDAAEALDCDSHAKLAAELSAQDQLATTKRDELHEVSADLKIMDGDAAAEAVFREAKMDHPRILAIATSQAIVARKKASFTLQSTLEDLTAAGIDPDILATHLRQLSTPGALQQLIANAASTTATTQASAGSLTLIAPIPRPALSIIPDPDFKNDADHKGNANDAAVKSSPSGSVSRVESPWDECDELTKSPIVSPVQITLPKPTLPKTINK